MTKKVPTEARPWPTAHAWLNAKLDNGEILFEDVIDLLLSQIDGDAIQDHWQSQMEEDKYFLPSYDWMMDNVGTEGMVLDEDGDVAEGGQDWESKPIPELNAVIDYCHDNFPDGSTMQDFYELGQRCGWWS